MSYGPRPADDPATQSTEAPQTSIVARTLSGVVFYPESNKWKYNDGLEPVSLNFEALTSFSDDLRKSAKLTLAWYAKNRSAAHLNNIFERLKHFATWQYAQGVVIDSITAVHFQNYRAALEQSKYCYAGKLSGLFKRWQKLAYPGIEPDLIILLSKLRLKGNAKGTAVLTMDPVHGPLTHIESEALQDALNDAYARGKVQDWEFILCWLFILLGQRSIQYAALKVCDVQVKFDGDGRKKYLILIPRAKQRGAGIRSQFKERQLIEQFGTVLVAYAEGVRSKFAHRIPDPNSAPLFPSEKVRHGAGVFEHHLTAESLGDHLKRVLSKLSVSSERTGRNINIASRRFRRTIGTRAAEEGHGPLVIAEMLDHTDTQNVGVYSANSPAIINRIDRAVAVRMAPLAQAFAGTLAPRTSALREDNRIIDLRVDQSGQAMGRCGQHGFCSFAAPIACYTCKSFEAWLDGPHEAVLEYLLKKREQLLEKSDLRIAAINDRTIMAVAAVAQKCAELNTIKLPAASRA